MGEAENESGFLCFKSHVLTRPHTLNPGTLRSDMVDVQEDIGRKEQNTMAVFESSRKA
jgi:hypothetical protein